MMSFDRFALLIYPCCKCLHLCLFSAFCKGHGKSRCALCRLFCTDLFYFEWHVLAASFKSLLILFLGIEIISIPLYILTGSDKRNLKSNEASLKYFLMGAFSTGLMLMGIALVYGATGTFQYVAMHVGYRNRYIGVAYCRYDVVVVFHVV